MPCDIFRIQSDERSIVLEDARYIAVLHRLSAQVPPTFHGLEQRSLRYAGTLQPPSEALNWTNGRTIQNGHPFVPSRVGQFWTGES